MAAPELRSKTTVMLKTEPWTTFERRIEALNGKSDIKMYKYDEVGKKRRWLDEALEGCASAFLSLQGTCKLTLHSFLESLCRHDEESYAH